MGGMESGVCVQKGGGDTDFSTNSAQCPSVPSVGSSSSAAGCYIPREEKLGKKASE